ncbi:MAG TPA: amidohydrolase family protein [Casimicrobiaceae bacterium]|nr:amidohydrolase family protein [Casimicrobiaceae bacterium]
MIIDSHAHYWKTPPPANPTLGVHHEPLGVDAFVRDMDDAGIDKVVQITRGVMGFDNSNSLEGAARYPDRIRVLGRIDAGAPDIEQQLRGWLKQPYMAGIRLMTMFPSEAPWFEDGTIDKLWPIAEREGIPISLYAPERSKLVASVAERFPALSVVVDHLGMRVWDIFDSPPPSMHDWPNLMALHRYPNVTIKVTGIPEVMVERYPFRRSIDRVREIYERFGPERMMWGSNYPPTKVVCSYREAKALIDDCAFLSSEDKDHIRHLTAARVFRLPW